MSTHVYCAVPDCKAETVLQTAIEVYGESSPFTDAPDTLIANTPNTGWWVDSNDETIASAFCPLHIAEGKRRRKRRANVAAARQLRHEAEALLTRARALEEEEMTP